MPIKRIKAIGSGIKNILKTELNKAIPIKRLKANLRSIERAFSLLNEYYSKASPYEIEYGTYGTINLAELKKRHLDEPFLMLSDRKFHPDYIKRAYKILKIKSLDVKDKTNAYITAKIKNSFISLKNSINENITQRLNKNIYRRS